MNVLCKLFGHKSLERAYDGAEYMEVRPSAIDGIGREHAVLYAECPRCDARHVAGAIHLPMRESERKTVALLKETQARLRNYSRGGR